MKGSKLAAAAALAAAALLGAKLLLGRRRRQVDRRRGIVSFSGRIIAALRADESDEAHPLFIDPLARALAGQEATEANRRYQGKAPEGSSRRLPVSLTALRTRWLDDALLAALGQPVSAVADPVLRAPGAAAATAAAGGAAGVVAAPADSGSCGAHAWQPEAGAPSPCQVVVLGAGMDTRPWRMCLPAGLAWFEVDVPQVVAAKRQLLEAAGAQLPAAGWWQRCAAAGVALWRAPHQLQTAEWKPVGADLAAPCWLAALQAAGFDARRPTVWLAEGLLMYLAPAAVDAVLREAAGASAPGSALLCLVCTGSILGAIEGLKATIPPEKAPPQVQMMYEWRSGVPETAGERRAFFAARGWRLRQDVSAAAAVGALGLRPELCPFARDPRMEGVLLLAADLA